MMQYLPMMSIYYPLQGGNVVNLTHPKSGNNSPGTSIYPVLEKVFERASARPCGSHAVRVFFIFSISRQVKHAHTDPTRTIGPHRGRACRTGQIRPVRARDRGGPKVWIFDPQTGGGPKLLRCQNWGNFLGWPFQFCVTEYRPAMI